MKSILNRDRPHHNFLLPECIYTIRIRVFRYNLWWSTFLLYHILNHFSWIEITIRWIIGELPLKYTFYNSYANKLWRIVCVYYVHWSYIYIINNSIYFNIYIYDLKCFLCIHRMCRNDDYVDIQLSHCTLRTDRTVVQCAMKIHYFVIIIICRILYSRGGQLKWFCGPLWIYITILRTTYTFILVFCLNIKKKMELTF